MRIGNEVRSHARAAASKAAAAALAMTLAVGLAPQFVQSGYAETPGENRGGGLYSSVASEAPADSLSDQAQETEGENEADAAGTAGAPLAAALVAGTQTSVVRGDVALTALDAEAQAVVGSFTADGLTFAIDAAGQVALVAVAPTEGFHSDADTEGASAEAADDATLSLPAAVSHDGADYALTRIAPLALDGAGITAVLIPSTVSAIDPSAALGCETLAEVAVSEANPFFSAFDGYLTDKALTSILLVPEGRIGQVRIPSTMATIDPRVFSHCARIDAFAVDADCPGLASWNGSLYTKDLTELLRAPAGATGLTLPPECAAIGPSALSGCTDLRSIDARGTVASIAPSAFGEIEEVEALPAAAVSSADEAAAPERPAQVTGLVAVASNALSSVQVDKAAISVTVPEGSDASAWEGVGLSVTMLESSDVPVASTQEGIAGRAVATYEVTVVAKGHKVRLEKEIWHQSTQTGGATGEYRSIDPSSQYTISTATCWRCVNSGSSQWADVGLWNENYTDSAGTHSFSWAIKADPTVQGYKLVGASTDRNAAEGMHTNPEFQYSSVTLYAIWRANTYTVAFDLNGATGATPASIAATYDQDVTLPAPTRTGYKFLGWNTAEDGSGETYQAGTARNLTATDKATVTLHAQWQLIDYGLGFDVDSEPGDVDYPGEPKDDQSANIESGQVPIEDPKRPGYVFEGWAIPNSDGTEAVDQDLVYQGDDGKWYVDASKLPDYAGDDGRVELTARWTSIISVDVPSSVTFYADLVTGQQDPQGEKAQASREGAASGAFGQSKVENQSEVDLRIVGLESSAVKTTDTTLGADSVLKKADAATPSTFTQKLLSLYPSTKQWKPDELQDPDAVGGDKPASVDFDLDDILLEKSFTSGDLPPDAFTIAAGDTLNMGYRLNLSETGQQLDYDKLSTLSEGQSAAIANVSYTFAAKGHIHAVATGSRDDDIYIEYDGKVYGTNDIVGAAECISELGEASPCYELYDAIMRAQGVPSNGYLPADAKAKVYAKYTGPEATATQPNCDRAGYVRLLLLGVNHDVLELKAGYPDANGFAGDGSKDAANGEPYVAKRAGLTFQFMDALFQGSMNATDTNLGGWKASAMRGSILAASGAVAQNLPIYGRAKQVWKHTYNDNAGGNAALTPNWKQHISATQDTLFFPSYLEVYASWSIKGVGHDGTKNSWQDHEGYQYEYWHDICGVARYSDGSKIMIPGQSSLIKLRDTSDAQWWLRSVMLSVDMTVGFGTVKPDGDAQAEVPASSGTMAIAPAFCL